MMHKSIQKLANLYSRLGVLKSPLFRLGLALAYTLVTTVLLVQSSGNPIVGPAAPPGPPSLGREIELTIAHVVVFTLLVGLWWWALLSVLPSSRALFVTVGFLLLYGLITELAQTLVGDRQPSLFDLAVNWTVTILAASVIVDRTRPRRRLPGEGIVVEDSRRMAAQSGRNSGSF